MKKKKIFWLLIMFLIFMSSIFLIGDLNFGIRYNKSSSLPVKLFMAYPKKEFSKYDYVSICHPKFPVLIAKQIMGIPGDKIEIVNDEIVINQKNCGKILSASPSGMVLTAIEQKEVPEDYFFVHSSNKESFDSRYEEFGLVSIDWIKEGLWPLF